MQIESEPPSVDFCPAAEAVTTTTEATAPVTTTTEATAPVTTTEATTTVTTTTKPSYGKSSKGKGKGGDGSKSGSKSGKAKTTKDSAESKETAEAGDEPSQAAEVVPDQDQAEKEDSAEEVTEDEAETEAEANDPNQVRVRCRNAVELAFPSQGWASESSLKLFAANVVSGDHQSETHFARPMGGGPGSQLTDFTGDDLLEWFAETLDPKDFRYTKIITSEVAVSNSVCSMDTLFIAVVGNCHMHVQTHLIVEVDEGGKLVKWWDHYDQELLRKEMDACKGKLVNIL
ncbi:hypothetical protein ACHAWF_004598 [Thalassiosira exigua]